MMIKIPVGNLPSSSSSAALPNPSDKPRPIVVTGNLEHLAASSQLQAPLAELLGEQVDRSAQMDGVDSQNVVNFIAGVSESVRICVDTVVANPDVGPADRARGVMEVCARHLCNVTNVACRTGLITLFSVALRELAAEGLRQLTLEPGTSGALAIVSSLVGPALNLTGWLRAERDGSANWHNRLGRFALALSSLGLTAWLVRAGIHDQLIPTLAGTVVYCGLRDSLNLLWQLPDNVNALHLGWSALAGMSYGLTGGALGYLSHAIEPGAGLSDHLAGLFQSMASSALPTALHTTGDDTMLAYLNSLGGTQDGGPLGISSRVDLWPDLQAFISKLTGTASLRMCALNVVNMVLSAALHAQVTGDEATSARLQSLLLGLAYFVIYVPFVAGQLPKPFGTAREAPETDIELLTVRSIQDPDMASLSSHNNDWAGVEITAHL